MQDDNMQKRAFTLLDTAAAATTTTTTSTSTSSARLGRFAAPGRTPISTPGYIAVTSRGAIPHIAPDVGAAHTDVKGVYVGFEDFIERSRHPIPPIFSTPVCESESESRLRKFMALDLSTLLILGPRRVPPVPCPTPSSATSVTIMSSDGYRQLPTEMYIDAVRRLRPDIVVGMADIVTGREPGVKRRERMVDRTHAWTGEEVGKLYRHQQEPNTETKTETELSAEAVDSLFFAPILPLSPHQQHLYTTDLANTPHISGLALYDSSSIDAVPDALHHLPRLALTDPQTPHDVLAAIARGVDLFTVPFAARMADAGIALDFEFPAPAPERGQGEGRQLPLPLGIDLWPVRNAGDFSKLKTGCGCYACATFTRAYVRHLLDAKEMLAWSLIHIHNLRILDNFFSGVRRSIEGNRFEEDFKAFSEVYESEMPVQTGAGPRLRGYQFKTEKGDGKRNERVYGRLEDAARKFGGDKGVEEVGVN